MSQPSDLERVKRIKSSKMRNCPSKSSPFPACTTTNVLVVLLCVLGLSSSLAESPGDQQQLQQEELMCENAKLPILRNYLPLGTRSVQ